MVDERSCDVAMKSTERQRRRKTKKGAIHPALPKAIRAEKANPSADSKKTFNRLGMGEGEVVELPQPKERGQEHHQGKNSGRSHDDEDDDWRDKKNARPDLLFSDASHVPLLG